jgi:ubiquinone/menaquinone biosynthesis C-methylase UbiE
MPTPANRSDEEAVRLVPRLAPVVVTPDPGVIQEAFDGIADRYDDTYRDARCRAEDLILASRLETFLRGTPGHHAIDTVLDAGCGTGLFMNLVKWWPQDSYTGLDISPAMLRRAETTFPRARFIEASLEDRLPLVDHSFDAVVSLYALSYVASPLHAVQELARVLHPGGRCLLVVYAPRWYRAYSHRVPKVDVTTSPAAWSCWQAAKRMELAGFVDVTLTAFSMLPTLLLRREATLAKRLPGLGRYLIIEGTRG